jgi:isopentenyl diphosphate isomerase/L-lactate dehydrogenase-like FMN-dependent dehydrogenase
MTFAGPVEDEVTLRSNIHECDAIRLKSKLLTDISSIDTGVRLLGTAALARSHPPPFTVYASGRQTGERPKVQLEVKPRYVISSFANTRVEDTSELESTGCIVGSIV